MTREPVGRYGWPWIALVTLLAIIYVPDMGHGFIRDDFAWIVHGQVHGLSDVWRIVATDIGFYRPIPVLSFSVNWWLFDLQPLPYGLTNFLLLVLCIGAIFRLGLALGLPAHGAFAAAALWSLNFHGINAAVLWPSARPGLFLVLGSALAAERFLRRRLVASAMWYAFAVFSKEEAVVLPVVFAAAHVVAQRRHALSRHADAPDGGLPLRAAAMNAVRATLPLLAVLAVYLLARTYSGAYWAHNAPASYRPISDVALLLRHIVEYLDRGATLAVAATCLVALVMRAMPRGIDLFVPSFCALWFTFAYALTVLAPVRSSLYVCFPSVGAALLAGYLITRIVPAVRQPHLLVVGLALFSLLMPVYWSRNASWVRLAERSTMVLSELAHETQYLPAPGIVNLIDDRSGSLRATFGSLPAAAELFLGGRVEVVLNADREADLTLRLVDGRLQRQ